MTVDIQLCQSGLTKVVTFTPFYLVSNLGKTDIEVREEGLQEWTTISAEKVRNENLPLKKIICTFIIIIIIISFVQKYLFSALQFGRNSRPQRSTSALDTAEQRKSPSCFPSLRTSKRFPR